MDPLTAPPRMLRTFTVPAQYAPSFDAAMDALAVQIHRGDVPEWGLAPCRPHEVLEITVVRKVIPPPDANPLVELVRSILMAPYTEPRKA